MKIRPPHGPVVVRRTNADLGPGDDLTIPDKLQTAPHEEEVTTVGTGSRSVPGKVPARANDGRDQLPAGGLPDIPA